MLNTPVPMSNNESSEKKKKTGGKGKVNKYGYTNSVMRRRARCAGLSRMHQHTGDVVERVLDNNIGNALRVAATRATIAKHHTIQLDYFIDGVQLATGINVLGYRVATKQQRGKPQRAAKKKQAAAAAAAAATSTSTAEAKATPK